MLKLEYMQVEKVTKIFQAQVNAAYPTFNILNVEEFFNWASEILEDETAGLVEYRTLHGHPFESKECILKQLSMMHC